MLRVLESFHFMLKIHRSCASPHNLCQSTNYPSYYGWLSHVDLANLIVLDATFALLVPFGAVLLHVMINGRLFVVVITHPPACRLAAVISHFLSLAGLTHLKLLSSSSLQSKARV